MAEKATNSGYTIIEVLIAISIFSVGILAVASMQNRSLLTSIDLRDTSEAQVLADTMADRLMGLPFYADDNGIDDDGNGDTDHNDVLPVLAVGTQTENADWTGPYTVRYNVQEVDDPVINSWATNGLDFGNGLNPFALGTRNIIKVIRVWVTPDDDPNNVVAQIDLVKTQAQDLRL